MYLRTPYTLLHWSPKTEGHNAVKCPTTYCIMIKIRPRPNLVRISNWLKTSKMESWGVIGDGPEQEPLCWKMFDQTATYVYGSNGTHCTDNLSVVVGENFSIQGPTNVRRTFLLSSSAWSPEKTWEADTPVTKMLKVVAVEWGKLRVNTLQALLREPWSHGVHRPHFLLSDTPR